MTSQLGLLPGDKNIFYATAIGDFRRENENCRLVLQDLSYQEKNTAFFIHAINYETGGHCLGPFDFDFKGINLESRSIRYRTLENQTWSFWKEAAAEVN